MRPSQAQPAEFSIQINHASGTGNRNLRPERYGKKLLDPPRSRIPDQLDGVGGGKFIFINKTTLRIIDALAGVEVGSACIHLTRVRDNLSAAQAERVLCIALVQFVEYQRKSVVIIKLVGQLCIRLIAGDCAMFAVAVCLKTGNIDYVIERPCRSTCSIPTACSA